jgi:1-deoxyxylulose-5-phosphate synthase
MKILGEGRITTPERKDASLRYVLGLGTVNAFIIGFEHTEQIDDLLQRAADAITFLKA